MRSSGVAGWPVFVRLGCVAQDRLGRADDWTANLPIVRFHCKGPYTIFFLVSLLTFSLPADNAGPLHLSTHELPKIRCQSARWKTVSEPHVS